MFIGRAAFADYYAPTTWDGVRMCSHERPLLLSSHFVALLEALPLLVAYADANGLAFGHLFSNARDIRRRLKEKRRLFTGWWIIDNGHVVECQKVRKRSVSSAVVERLWRQCSHAPLRLSSLPLLVAGSIECVREGVERYRSRRRSPIRVGPPQRGAAKKLLQAVNDIRCVRPLLANLYDVIDELCNSGDLHDVEGLIDGMSILEYERDYGGHDDSTRNDMEKHLARIDNTLYRITGRKKGWFSSPNSSIWIQWWRLREQAEKSSGRAST